MDYLNESFDRLSADKDHLEEIEMYKMFILLNALALGDNSEQLDSVCDEYISSQFTNILDEAKARNTEIIRNTFRLPT